MTLSPFFQLHSALPREGPGEPEDVFRTARRIGPRARVADMACGPGADIPALLEAFSGAHVNGVDLQAHFVSDARAQRPGSERVTVLQGEMADLDGPFDLIWCGGALYFLGLETGLGTMREKLAPTGVLAFSRPCFFTDLPSGAAVGFWGGDPVDTERDILAAVAAAGFRVRETWKVSDAAWRAYYGPKRERIAKLRPDAAPELLKILDTSEREAALGEEVRDETGYLFTVAEAA